jgi:hypothetical protein
MRWIGTAAFVLGLAFVQTASAKPKTYVCQAEAVARLSFPDPDSGKPTPSIDSKSEIFTVEVHFDAPRGPAIVFANKLLTPDNCSTAQPFCGPAKEWITFESGKFQSRVNLFHSPRTFEFLSYMDGAFIGQAIAFGVCRLP